MAANPTINAEKIYNFFFNATFYTNILKKIRPGFSVLSTACRCAAKPGEHKEKIWQEPGIFISLLEKKSIWPI